MNCGFAVCRGRDAGSWPEGSGIRQDTLFPTEDPVLITYCANLDVPQATLETVTRLPTFIEVNRQISDGARADEASSAVARAFR